MDIRDMPIIICVDPGKGGGIASGMFNPDTHEMHMVRTVNMPETSVEMNKYFGYLIEGKAKVFAFVENITVFPGDKDKGKMFPMQKLHNNFTQLKTMFELRGIRLECPMPATWQTQLHLRKKGVKEESAIRKRRYKEFATKHFPTVAVTLKNGDCLCLLEWARRKMVYERKKYQ